MLLNSRVLMSGVEHFSDEAAINPYMDATVAIDIDKARREHESIKQALQAAGVQVESVDAPAGCQDGVYTANWALCRGKKAVLASLPNMRTAEEPHADAALRELGYEVIKPPVRFSGQGDALPCGNLLFAGSQYRTDPTVHQFLAEKLGFEVISLQTVPALDHTGRPVINAVTGWPDSFFYDIDLALSVLRTDLIAWCPEAFTPLSQERLRAVPIEKIEVSLKEATESFACNLVSTGETVIMSSTAPKLRSAIESRGLKTITPGISELAKGGGYIRCTSLTLDNE